MIVDVRRIAEDRGRVAYLCENAGVPASLVIVEKATLDVSVLIEGDRTTAAASVAKIRRTLTEGEYPDRLSVETG